MIPRESVPSLVASVEEPTPERTSDGPVRSDVIIAGAGLGGLAAAIHLRRAGLSVVCIEPEPFPHAKVGESFDWSAPRLLQSLGLSAKQLVDEGMAIYKRGIRVEAVGRSPWDAQPAAWFARKPLEFEYRHRERGPRAVRSAAARTRRRSRRHLRAGPRVGATDRGRTRRRLSHRFRKRAGGRVVH